MPKIGSFNRSPNGFTVHIRTISFNTNFVLVALDRAARGSAPDYRIHLNDAAGPEVGAGWTRTGDRAGEFIVVQLDDPILLAPIRAHLFRDSDSAESWSLHWNRARTRSDQD